MSLSPTTYLGPYFECKRDENKTHQYEEVEEGVKERIAMIRGTKLYRYMDHKKIDIWVGNIIKLEVGLSFDPNEEEIISNVDGVGDNNPVEQIMELCDNYEKELDFLYKVYGKSNVRVRWGLINRIN